ncbi:MAG: hypothetical protein KKH94_12390 [Candidatus Omnitrophica bacterium]|nr:hypothetical protein [bacterium]MBU1864451.1 hypothetical protein [Candidatus Omnitrophota bacterium]
MNFKKYAGADSWEECLQIFLFSELVLKHREFKSVHIEDYKSFELRDAYIATYNSWVEKGITDENIKKWIQNNEKEILKFKEKFGGEFKKKVEIWSDRTKTDYFKKQLQASFEFEEFLKKFFKDKYGLDLGQYLTPEGQYYKGENELGIEIKHDMMYKKTGNLYIEYAEKAKSENTKWINSGIEKEDNTTYFLIGDYEKFWVFRKERLLEILEEERQYVKEGKPSHRCIRFVAIATSKGFIYPIVCAAKETLNLNVLIEEIKKKIKG